MNATTLTLLDTIAQQAGELQERLIEEAGPLDADTAEAIARAALYLDAAGEVLTRIYVAAAPMPDAEA